MFLLRSNLLLTFIIETVKKFIKAGASARAERLAFSTLLAIVPFLAIFMGILKSFPAFNQFDRFIEDFIFLNFIPTMANILQKYLHDAINNAFKLSAISLIFLGVIVIEMGFIVTESFDAIWEAKPKRSLLKASVLYGTILILLPVLTGFTLFLTFYINSLPYVSVVTHLKLFNNLSLVFMPLASAFFSFFLLYYILPDVQVKFKPALYGALLAALLFMAAKNGFEWYIRNFTSYEIIYAGFSFIPIVLIWIYVSWVIVLTGGIFTYIFQNILDLPEKNI